MSTTSQVLHQSQGGEKLVLAQFQVASAFPYNAANYYTITLRRILSGATYGGTIGSAYSLATRSLSANSPVTLYSNAAGLMLNEGDTLVSYLVSSGSPAVLSNPSWILDIQTIAR